MRRSWKPARPGRTFALIALLALLALAGGWPGDAPAQEQEPSRWTVYFELNSAELQRLAEETLNGVLAAAVSRDDVLVSVTGHADRSGPAAFNEELSLRRAQAVRQVLVTGGLDPESVSVAARGESAPATPTPDGVVEPGNRRVDIILK